MNAETFCEHFSTFAEAPNGVAKLRELILQLAIQGKLVPPDVNDEPAARLLERVIAAKPKDTGATRSKSAWPVAERTTNLMSFEVPSTWTWCRLEDIAPNVQYGYTASADASLRGIRLLRITDIQNNMVDWPSVPGCEIDENTYQAYSLHDDDIVIARTGGTIGKSFLVQGISVRAVFASYLIRVTPSDELHAPYIKRFLESPTYWTQLQTMSAGTGQPNVNGTALKSLLVPLPPLAEQRRIVEKVDQLLGLCDELAARQAAKRELRSALVGATLDRLVSARSAAEFPTHAYRLRDHFDRLFDTPTTIPQLRQAILQLAVQGQLVPQYRNDESASLLVEQIAKFKANATGKPSKITLLESVARDAPLPHGWVAARFGDIMVNRDGERIPVSREIREGRKGPYDYYGASGVIDCIDDFLFDKPLLLIGEDGANLINRSTPIAFIAQGKYWVNNHAHVLDGISIEFLRYIELHINAIDLKPFVTGTAQPKMNQAKMNSIPIALPPLSEQKRIVSKVNELLSLCDALEAKLTQAESASAQLLSAAIHDLLTKATSTP